MGDQWKRKLTVAEVRELRRWWAARERAYFEYVNTPNPREMGAAMGLSPSCVRKAGMGHTYKEVK